MHFCHPDAELRYDELVAAAAGTVVGLDFDGTLAPIVDDPTVAHIHPDAQDVLADLAEVVRSVAVITGRPARQVLALGGLDEVGDELEAHHHPLHVFGQYGNERWDSHEREIDSARPPAGLARFTAELPGLLREAGVSEALVEEKGLAVAIHTRQLAEPDLALRRLLDRLESRVAGYGLALEPGRHVVEVRSPGMDKGKAVRTLVDELGATGFMFAGDDLGDVEAFKAVAQLRESGLATLLVCSVSNEESALIKLADVVVPGPEGVLALLRKFSSDVRGAAAIAR